MPTIAEDSSALEKLVTEIYQQKWPPPDIVADNTCSAPSRKGKVNGLRYWNENERSGYIYNRIGRPFSANFFTSTQRDGRISMNAGRSPSSQLDDVKLLNTATFQKKKKQSSKVIEYDSKQVISESAAARNRVLAAEYLAMLSGKNYLKRHYREQYWINDTASRTRPKTAVSSKEQRQYATLYPDLGSVLGSRVSQGAVTATKLEKPPRPASTWRLSSASHNTPSPRPAPTCTLSDHVNEDKTVVSELGLAFQAKKSWSNVPSGKCHRLHSYPNETLASLCLEGRCVPSRSSNSRTSSFSSTISISGMLEERYTSAGESPPSGSSESPIEFTTGSGDEDVIKSSLASVNSYQNERQSAGNADEKANDILQIADSVFDESVEQGPQDHVVMIDDEQNDEYCEFSSDLLEEGVGRISFSDLEESDISENEADDYEEETVDENEASRRIKQVSAVFDTDFHVATVVDPASGSETSSNHDSDEDDNRIEQAADDTIRYYGDILPPPYKEIDLKAFANLPPGMDWRNFTHEGALAPSRLSKDAKKDDVPLRLRNRRSRRETAKLKNMEDYLDRLVMLEKLQVITTQYERDRKKHLIHRAKARSAARASAATSQTNSSNLSVTSPKEADVRPQSARVLRRRLSNVGSTSLANMKPRKPSLFGDSKIDIILSNKSSPDLDLVKLSCTKNHLQYIRRNSASPRKKQRPGLFLPRHYEYSWSERLPPSKRPSLNSLAYAKPRNCQYCRESEKKAHLQTLQLLMNRPRSSCSTVFNTRQRVRPASSSAIIIQTPKQLIVSENGQESANIRNTTGNQGALSNRDSGTFGKASPSAGAQLKINSARLSLATVSREYAKAAGKSSKFPRRTSASSYRNWRSGRSSPAVSARLKADTDSSKLKLVGTK